VIEFARQSAKNRIVDDVAPTLPTAGQAAEMPVLGNEDYGLPHTSRQHRSDHTAGRIAINYHVRFQIIFPPHSPLR
jgi:hypothetical protein